jgi:hypothetical protein
MVLPPVSLRAVQAGMFWHWDEAGDDGRVGVPIDGDEGEGTVSPEQQSRVLPSDVGQQSVRPRSREKLLLD